MVNGSLPQMSLQFMTDKQQEDICSELTVLHLCSLELLTAIIKAMGSQLLPHAASIVRIITKYFKTCALPELRIKVQSQGLCSYPWVLEWLYPLQRKLSTMRLLI